MVKRIYYRSFLEKCIEQVGNRGICIWGARRTGRNLLTTILENSLYEASKVHIVDRNLKGNYVNNILIEDPDEYLNNSEYMIICAAEVVSTAYMMGAEILGDVPYSEMRCVTERYANFYLYIEDIVNSSAELMAEERSELDNLVATLYSHQNYVSDLIVGGEYKNVAPISTKIGCPINCKYCPQDVLIKAYKNRPNPVMELSFDNFVRMLSHIPKTVIISFTGFVEPFANPRCTDMIMYALENDYVVRVFSTLYNVTIDQYKRFKDHKNLKTLDIHIPDSNYNTQFPITEQYKETLTYVVNNPPKYARLWTSCLGVTSKERDEIRDIIHVDGNPINSIHGLVYDNHLSHRGAKLKCNRDCSRIDNKRAGVGMIVPNGDVFACTQDWELENYIGNIFEVENWDQLMQGELRLKFRDALDNPRIDNICTYCELALETDQGDIIKG